MENFWNIYEDIRFFKRSILVDTTPEDWKKIELSTCHVLPKCGEKQHKTKKFFLMHQLERSYQLPVIMPAAQHMPKYANLHTGACNKTNLMHDDDKIDKNENGRACSRNGGGERSV
jgi:hypothetical protein